MEQVKLPDDYFRKSRGEYVNWMFAWWREAIQNALDAGATKINITVESPNFNSNSNTWKLLFTDNGVGMSRRVLEEAFLTMGGTVKGVDSVGGFGYAKVLLLFAQHKWSIRTGNISVYGEGGYYDILENCDEVKGTAICVSFLTDEVSEDGMANELNRFMWNSRLKGVEVYLNGGRFNCAKTKGARFSIPQSEWKTVSTDYGNIIWTKNPNTTKEIWVCHRGIPMFRMPSYEEKPQICAYIEMSPALSGKDIFTSNRDGLRSDMRIHLQSYISTLMDSPEAFKQGREHKQIINPAGGLLVPEYKPKPIYFDKGYTAAAAKSTREQSKIESQFESACTHMPRNFFLFLRNTRPEKIREALQICQSRRGLELGWMWNVMVNYILGTIASKPSSLMEDSGLKSQSILEDKDDFMRDYTFIKGGAIHTGFIFAEDVMGLHHKNGSDIAILVNPLLHPESMPWIRGKANSEFVPEDLFVTAVHEVGHLITKNHSTLFIDTLDRIRSLLARAPLTPADLETIARNYTRRVFPTVARKRPRRRI